MILKVEQRLPDHLLQRSLTAKEAKWMRLRMKMVRIHFNIHYDGCLVLYREYEGSLGFDCICFDVMAEEQGTDRTNQAAQDDAERSEKRRATA